MPEAFVATVIGCDTDPIMSSLHDKKGISWEKAISNIFHLKEMFEQINLEDMSQPRITWLLRSDTQMKIVYGDYAYPVKHFFDFWKNLQNQGDEIGWHPHFWNWSERRKCWYPVLNNMKWIENCLNRGYSAICQYFKPMSVRVGFDFQTNYTMRKLADLGILVDFSALPGLKVIGFSISDPPCYYDWEITSPEFYFPSTTDYRRKAEKGENCLKILEMPISLVRVPIYRAIAKYLYHNGMLNLKMGFCGLKIPFKCQQQEPILMARHSRLLRLAIVKKFRIAQQKDCTTYLVSYFHPEDLGNIRAPEGIRSLSNFKKNLLFILKTSKKYDMPVKFLTATEAAKEYISKMHTST